MEQDRDSDSDNDNTSTSDQNVDPGANVLERTRLKPARPHMYGVVLLNDDYTPMDFVVFVIKKVFNKPQAEAEQITMDVHKKGRATVGVYTLEVAETKILETMQLAKLEKHPLQAALEPL